LSEAQPGVPLRRFPTSVALNSSSSGASPAVLRAARRLAAAVNQPEQQPALSPAVGDAGNPLLLSHFFPPIRQGELEMFTSRVMKSRQAD